MSDHERPHRRPERLSSRCRASLGFSRWMLLFSWALVLVAILAYQATHPASAVLPGEIPAPNLEEVSRFYSMAGGEIGLEDLLSASAVAFVSSRCAVCVENVASLARTLERTRQDRWFMVVLDGPEGAAVLQGSSGIAGERLLLPIRDADRDGIDGESMVPMVPTVVEYSDGHVTASFAGVPGPLWGWQRRLLLTARGGAVQAATRSDLVSTKGERTEASQCELVPQLEDATELPVSTADGQLMYDQARSAFFLGQDSMVVVGRSSIAVFDGAGRGVATIGRAGQGPGEFRRLAGAWPGERGEIIAVDRLGWRTTTFRTDGTIIAEQMITGAHDRGWQVVKPLGDGRWLFLVDVPLATGAPGEDEPGIVTPQRQLVSLHEGAVDSLLALEGQPRYQDLSLATEGYLFSAPLPFGPTFGLTLLSQNRLLVSTGRDPTISILDLESGEIVEHLDVSPTAHPISQRERREWEARYLTGSEELNRRTQGILDRISNPPTRPPHRGAGIQWDGARNLVWVPEYRSYIPWADTLRITLRPLDGDEEARIRFPGMASVLDVSEDAALLLHRSELDEETVVRVPLTCR